MAVLFISPPESLKPDISQVTVHAQIRLEKQHHYYSKNLSLIEIFEKSESGVVRVNVQRGETEDVGQEE